MCLAASSTHSRVLGVRRTARAPGRPSQLKACIRARAWQLRGLEHALGRWWGWGGEFCLRCQRKLQYLAVPNFSSSPMCPASKCQGLGKAPFVVLQTWTTTHLFPWVQRFFDSARCHYELYGPRLPRDPASPATFHDSVGHPHSKLSEESCRRKGPRYGLGVGQFPDVPRSLIEDLDGWRLIRSRDLCCNQLFQGENRL